MTRKRLALGLAFAAAAGLGVGNGIRRRLRRRSTADERTRPASLSGESRAAGADLPRPVEAPRTATRMAPGIPVGSGKGIDRALEQPDTKLGGGVAGDTTPGSSEQNKERDDRVVRDDDRSRTTL